MSKKTNHKGASVARITDKQIKMLQFAVLLALAWLLWSGLFKPLLVAFGAFSCLLVLYLAKRMHFFDTQFYALRYGPRLLGYWAWLVKEVVKSSFEVARVVLDPKLPISPQIVDIKATASHPVDQVLLANSITLTPGTLALDVHNGIIKVHSLTKAGADELMSGEMDRRVAELHKD